MTSKLVIGKQPWLALASDAWKKSDPALDIIEFEVGLTLDYRFDLGTIPDSDAANITAFVAWGPDFLNFQRLELVGELKKLGYKMPPLICQTAIIGGGARVMENAWIQPFVFVGSNSVIGTNSFIGMHTSLLYACEIDKSVWIGANVRLGAGVKVGAHSLLGDSIYVADQISIGKNVRIDKACDIVCDWADGQFSLQNSGLQGKIIDLSLQR
jgi:hypothetical protein